MRALEGLNKEQIEAVKACDTHLLIVAGAGSGKTRVLTHKIVHLIEDHGFRPSEVLAMTFSNKAAGEMRHRVQSLLPSYELPHWIGTFHSICLRILKDFSFEASLPPQFTIYDESDQLSVVKRALKELKLDPKQLPPKLIRSQIGRAKNETGDILPYLQEEGVMSKLGLRVVERYQSILQENGALDFGDLLTRTVDLIRKNKDVAGDLRARWKHILIDEYQDTNRIQKELIRELKGEDTKICAVGDEDQSIYGWRGARVENIMEFDRDFQGAKIVKLEQNYRSTKKILSAANHVITKNRGRRKKTLWTENDTGEKVRFFLAEDDYRECDFILDTIETWRKDDGVDLRDITLFYRTHVQSRIFEENCRRRDLPYRILGGVRFYDRQEIKNALAFLKLSLNTLDKVSFQRIINVPSKGIGTKTIENLLGLAAQRQKAPLDAMAFLSGRSKGEKALLAFHEWFTLVQDDALNQAPAEVLESILDKSGYVESLENEGTVEAEARMENLNELLRSMEEFYEETGGSLAEYMDQVSLVSETDKLTETESCLTMMTMHNSKGLEYDYVFVVGMEEGIFPHQRSLDEGDEEEMEEERRLCYVAMTRARKKLYFTAAEKRRLYRNTVYNPVSRFVGEIPSSDLKDLSEETYVAPSDQTVTIYYDTPIDHKRKQAKKKVAYDEYHQPSYDDLPARSVWGKAAAQAALQSAIPPGTKVMHPEFGEGTVQRCEGSKDNPKLTIDFGRAGRKKLLYSHANLEIISH